MEGRIFSSFTTARLSLIGFHPLAMWQVAAAGALHLSGEVALLKVKRGRYPQPSPAFAATPEVQALWARYSGYLNGQEPLLAMAYFCLTILERGNRKAAAKAFGIDVKVLKKLGELTSTRGDLKSARKMTQRTVPITSQEAEWVESAIKAIIRHLAEQPKTLLTLRDLPRLS